MKKLFIVLLLITSLFGVFLLSACGDGNDGDVTKVHIVVPDGAPALSIAKLLKDEPVFDGYEVTYEIVNGAQPVTDRVAAGEAQLAIVPTNTAAVFYNNGIAKMLSVNTHGVLYLMGKRIISDLSELKGEVVYNIGRGTVPDLSFKYILQKKGIPYEESDTATDGKVSLAYVSSGTELIPMLKNGAAVFGILGEPAVTQAKNNAGVNVLFGIKEMWKEVEPEAEGYPQSALIGLNSFLKTENNAFINRFLELLEENEQWITENPAEAGEAVKAYGSTLNVEYSAEIITNCNISIMRSAEAKASVSAYLAVLAAFNAAAVGGAVPADGFYYTVG